MDGPDHELFTSLITRILVTVLIRRDTIQG